MRFAFIIAALLLSSCSSSDRIVVGSKNFTEQVILGELLAQHLANRTGLKIDRRLNLGGTLICHQAMISGQIDLYVEYTGTALMAILKLEPTGDRAKDFATVRRAYRSRLGIEWTEPLGFNNSFAIIVRADTAKELNLKTVSDAAPFTGNWVAGFGYEFMERKDGYPGLAQTYQLQFPDPPRVMDLGLTYKALAAGQVDLIAGNSTDGLINSLNLVILEDDQHYFPPYEAVPVVRSQLIAEHPQVREALQELGGLISAREMQQLNYQVDGKHVDVKRVVRTFLQSKGL